MSALENPATLANLWQDPWCSAVTAGAVTTSAQEDFYQPNKANVQAGFYHHQPMAVHHAMHHGYPVHHGPPSHNPIMEGGQNNNNNSMNSDANSSSTLSTTSSTAKDLNKPHRQVNFKLDIKAEPDMEQTVQTGMQKVPSISDLSDPDSSLDIPCSQVRPLQALVLLIKANFFS